MTETDMREAVARLEAKIKGPSWRAYQYSGPPTLDTNHGDWLLYDEAVPVPAGRESFHATPHDTDPGRLEWLGELFQVEVRLGRSIDNRWYCALEADHLIGRGDTLPDAITDAIEAAALEGEKQGG